MPVHGRRVVVARVVPPRSRPISDAAAAGAPGRRVRLGGRWLAATCRSASVRRRQLQGGRRRRRLKVTVKVVGGRRSRELFTSARAVDTRRPSAPQTDIGNASVPTQLAQCRFPGPAISNAKILIYFSNKIHESSFVEQHSETVMV